MQGENQETPQQKIISQFENAIKLTSDGKGLADEDFIISNIAKTYLLSGIYNMTYGAQGKNMLKDIVGCLFENLANIVEHEFPLNQNCLLIINHLLSNDNIRYRPTRTSKEIEAIKKLLFYAVNIKDCKKNADDYFRGLTYRNGIDSIGENDPKFIIKLFDQAIKVSCTRAHVPCQEEHQHDYGYLSCEMHNKCQRIIHYTIAELILSNEQTKKIILTKAPKLLLDVFKIANQDAVNSIESIIINDEELIKAVIQNFKKEFNDLLDQTLKKALTEKTLPSGQRDLADAKLVQAICQSQVLREIIENNKKIKQFIEEKFDSTVQKNITDLFENKDHFVETVFLEQCVTSNIIMEELKPKILKALKDAMTIKRTINKNNATNEIVSFGFTDYILLLLLLGININFSTENSAFLSLIIQEKEQNPFQLFIEQLLEAIKQPSDIVNIDLYILLFVGIFFEKILNHPEMHYFLEDKNNMNTVYQCFKHALQKKESHFSFGLRLKWPRFILSCFKNQQLVTYLANNHPGDIRAVFKDASFLQQQSSGLRLFHDNGTRLLIQNNSTRPIIYNEISLFIQHACASEEALHACEPVLPHILNHTPELITNAQIITIYRDANDIHLVNNIRNIAIQRGIVGQLPHRNDLIYDNDNQQIYGANESVMNVKYNFLFERLGSLYAQNNISFNDSSLNQKMKELLQKYVIIQDQEKDDTLTTIFNLFDNSLNSTDFLNLGISYLVLIKPLWEKTLSEEELGQRVRAWAYRFYGAAHSNMISGSSDQTRRVCMPSLYLAAALDGDYSFDSKINKPLCPLAPFYCDNAWKAVGESALKQKIRDITRLTYGNILQPQNTQQFNTIRNEINQDLITYIQTTGNQLQSKASINATNLMQYLQEQKEADFFNFRIECLQKCYNFFKNNNNDTVIQIDSLQSTFPYQQHQDPKIDAEILANWVFEKYKTVLGSNIDELNNILNELLNEGLFIETGKIPGRNYVGTNYDTAITSGKQRLNDLVQQHTFNHLSKIQQLMLLGQKHLLLPIKTQFQLTSDKIIPKISQTIFPKIPGSNYLQDVFKKYANQKEMHNTLDFFRN